MRRALAVGIAVAGSACGRVGFAERGDAGAASDAPIADGGPDALVPLSVTSLSFQRGRFELVEPVLEGATLDVTSIATGTFGVVAEVAGAASRVEFVKNGTLRVEDAAPYASGGDNVTNLGQDGALVVGSNTVAVTAYGALGEAGPTATTSFILEVTVATPPQITTVELINDNGPAVVFATLTDGVAIPIGTFGGVQDLDVRIQTSPPVVGSVRIAGVGPWAAGHVDAWPVYTAMGPTTGFPAQLGSYQLVITPFTLGRATGTAGPTVTINFDIVP